MSDSLNNYRVLCKAISLLLPNQLEIVIHDLNSGKIAHIENPYSNRNVGDDSLIDEDELTTEIDNKDAFLWAELSGLELLHLNVSSGADIAAAFHRRLAGLAEI